MTLKELHLKNIILVEDACLPFFPGFNVISGESGSGKSAIINALDLIAGVRCDLSVIRHGKDKAIVEAVFDIDGNLQLKHLLDEAGIDHEKGNDLYIRRELTLNGKSRALINNQLVQLNVLRQVAPLLFEIAGQHANQKLLSIDFHRQVIDIYGGIERQSLKFAELFKELVDTELQLDRLKFSESERHRQIDVLLFEIGEIEEANIKEGEEEELFIEYSHLSSAAEITEKTGEILRVLTGEKSSALHQLSRLKSTFDGLAKLNLDFVELKDHFETARLELEEIAYSIQKIESRIEQSPEKLEAVNFRLSSIVRLKKKYGPAVDDINAHLQSNKLKLSKLESAECEIEQLTEKLAMLKKETDEEAYKLSESRAKVAKDLELAVQGELKSLNMQKAEIYVALTPQKRTSHGDEKIEFYLKPNVGEQSIPLKDSASGGELSRILLALQTLLSGKEKVPTLIFDEIDANIGGETASIVGEKLSGLSKHTQVLCITHFPQVAKQSHHHLKIYKEEISGRTVTLTSVLDEKGKQQEINRMLGNRTHHRGT